MRTMIIVVGTLIIGILLVWIGLQIEPAAFPPLVQQAPPIATIALPVGLPAPVERFYRAFYGERIPVLTSAVLTGHALMRPIGGITLPTRFRFIYEAGKGYRHYIEVTFFGFPIMQINEQFLDGKARLELPFGVAEGEQVDQGATLGLWAESIWLPAIYLTDPRVRWEAVDEETALLIVPAATKASADNSLANQTETYVVRFDADSGLITWFESMRYQDATSTKKTLWLNQILAWGTQDGKPFATAGAAIWMDNGKPWAVFTVEDVIYNLDVQTYIRAKGP